MDNPSRNSPESAEQEFLEKLDESARNKKEKYYEKELSEFERIEGQVRNRFYGAMAISVGSFLALGGILHSSGRLQYVVELLETYPFVFVGAITSALGLYVFLAATNRISDIDFMRRASRRSKISLAPQAAWPFPTVNNIVEEDPPQDFKSTIKGMTEILQQQAEVYDEKASKLLDKGILYAALGIIFFLFSIVLWQVIFHLYGFNEAHIYGIISCASLFIAVEVISAWFLRQYRNFIDSATELLKIKAIFDKIMLLKIASEEVVSSESMEAQLGATLARDFVWPERISDKNRANVDMKTVNELLSIVQKMVKGSKSES